MKTDCNLSLHYVEDDAGELSENDCDYSNCTWDFTVTTEQLSLSTSSRDVSNTCENYSQYQYNYFGKKSIADTNTNTAVEKYCQYQYRYFCDNTFRC